MSEDCQIEEVFSVAWWNTSLRPIPTAIAPTANQMHVATEIVKALITNGVDFIALGEISESERDIFISLANDSSYAVRDGLVKEGRSRFSMCYVYNPGRVTVSSPIPMFILDGPRRLRVCQHLEVVLQGEPFPFHILVSHWPSRLRDAAADRSRLGMRLRDVINRIYSESVGVPHIILLGDYNDEPFDDSMCNCLRATRDKRLVFQKQDLLYNPFWRHLGGASDETANAKLGGSYFYRKDQLTRWRLFDQIIFSSSFLNGGLWTLDESMTQIMHLPFYTDLLVSSKETFDHAPILGVVRRGNANGRI